MPIKLKANNGNIDLKAPIKQVGGKVDSVNGMTGDVVLEIPSKTSDLVNDSGFLTSIPDEYITETELDAKGYLTEHQSLADYAKKSEIPDVSGFLTSIPDEYVTEAELDAKGYLTEHQSLAEYAKKSDIPDVSGFITEIPSEYVTETELDAKGYLTEHQSLAEYATKDYVSNALTPYAKTENIPDVSGFTTMSAVEAKGYQTAEQVQTIVDTAIAGITDGEAVSY